MKVSPEICGGPIGELSTIFKIWLAWLVLGARRIIAGMD